MSEFFTTFSFWRDGKVFYRSKLSQLIWIETYGGHDSTLVWGIFICFIFTGPQNSWNPFDIFFPKVLIPFFSSHSVKIFCLPLNYHLCHLRLHIPYVFSYTFFSPMKFLWEIKSLEIFVLKIILGIIIYPFVSFTFL